MNFRILFRILIAAFILTLVTSQIKYYNDFQGVSTRPDANDSVQGFPFKTITYSYLFWTAGIVALIFLKRESQKQVKLNIFLASVCALTLMQIYLLSQSSCIKGYPVKFFSICGGLSSNNPILFFAILDFIFWLAIGLIVVALVKVVERLPKLFIFRVSYFFIPLILTLLSFVNYISCSGFFCFGPSGRGFPIYYYIDSYPPIVNLKYFIIDYVFWFILYLIIRGVWNLLRKWYLWKKGIKGSNVK